MQLLLWLPIQVPPALRQFCNMPVQKWRAFLPEQALVLQVVAPGVRPAAQQKRALAVVLQIRRYWLQTPKR